MSKPSSAGSLQSNSLSERRLGGARAPERSSSVASVMRTASTCAPSKNWMRRLPMVSCPSFRRGSGFHAP